LVSVLIAGLMLFGFLMFLRYSPTVGAFALRQVRAAAQLAVFPDPPNVGATEAPLLVPLLPDGPNPGTQATAAPGATATAAPPASGGNYAVTDPTGATVRSACDSTSGMLGTIPVGAIVTLDTPVQSNCVDNVCQRAKVLAVDPMPSGFNPVGGCLHLAAVTHR